jgi:hypothetical protein
MGNNAPLGPPLWYVAYAISEDTILHADNTFRPRQSLSLSDTSLSLLSARPPSYTRNEVCPSERGPLGVSHGAHKNTLSRLSYFLFSKPMVV